MIYIYICIYVCFDRSGFGSGATTLKDAREEDKNITKEDVEELSRKMLKLKESLVARIVL